MKLSFYATTLVCLSTAIARRLADDADLEPASWCFTYLSDILVYASISTLPEIPPPTISLLPGPSPFSTENGAQTAISSLSSESRLQSGILVSSPTNTALIQTSTTPTNTLPSSLSTTPGSGTSTSVILSPTPSIPSTRDIIFFISPSIVGRKRYLEARANTGFLNNDVDESQQRCDNATIFTLALGQLSDSGSPINYQPGDSFKQLRSTGSLPDGAISTTFTVDKGFLKFLNSSLPGGEASFCADGIGNVYVTFTSSPLNCEPVLLTSFGVELCQDGEIVGADLPSALSTPARASSASSAIQTESRGSDSSPTIITTSSSSASVEETSVAPDISTEEASSPALRSSTSSTSSFELPQESAHLTQVLPTTPITFGASFTESTPSYDASSVVSDLPSIESLQPTLSVSSLTSKTVSTTLSGAELPAGEPSYSPSSSFRNNSSILGISTVVSSQSSTFVTPETIPGTSRTSPLKVGTSSTSQSTPSSDMPKSNGSTSSQDTQPTDQSSNTIVPNTSSTKQTGSSKTSEAESVTSTTTRPGIEISFSFSPTTPGAPTSSPQASDPQPSGPQSSGPQSSGTQLSSPEPSNPRSSSPRPSESQQSGPRPSSQSSSSVDESTTGSTSTPTENLGSQSILSGVESITTSVPVSTFTSDLESSLSGDEPSTVLSSAEETTSIPTSTPTPVCDEGLDYAVYFFPPGSPECAELARTTQTGDPLNLDLAAVIENKVPRTVGTYGELDLSGVSVEDHCVVIVLRGYIVLNETGQYTLNVLGTVRDLAYVWVGDAALSGTFEPGNSVLRRYRDSQQSALNSASFLGSEPTQYTPIRIFMGSPILYIWFQISATTPSDVGFSFVTCSAAGNAPEMGPWEQERVGIRSPSSNVSGHSSVTSSTLSSTVEESTSSTSTSTSSSSTSKSSTSASSTNISSTSSSSTSSTSTPTSTPTPVCEDGVEYAIYFFKRDETEECQKLIDTSLTNDPLNLNLARIIEDKIPHATGVTPNIRGLLFDPHSGEPTTIYDYTTPSDIDASQSCTVIYHRGYLALSIDDSSYSLIANSNVDDLVYVWVGETALSGGFDPSNSVIRGVSSTDNKRRLHYNFGAAEGSAVTRDVTRYIPIRVFYVNFAGPGYLSLAMSGTPAPRYITCSGDQNAPSWPPWEQERTFSPAPACPPGLQYAIYTYSTSSPEYEGLDYAVQRANPKSAYLRDLIQNKPPQFTGNKEIVEGTLDGDFDGSTVIQFRGFVELRGPGAYTFAITGDPDTVFYVWLGDDALSGNFNPDNSQLMKMYQSDVEARLTYSFYTSETYKYLPIRAIYANLEGLGAFRLSFVGPANVLPPSLVQCSGNNARDWLPWDQETTGEVIVVPD